MPAGKFLTCKLDGPLGMLFPGGLLSSPEKVLLDREIAWVERL